MFQAIKRIVDEHEDIKVVYPIHMNPMIKELADEIFTETKRVKIIPPMEVVDFHNLLAKSHIILTDSGGIQEEAPSLGKPVLVMRDTTERPEGIEAGTLKLVGTEEEVIYEHFKELLENQVLYKEMSEASNPYGDGTASEQIVTILKEKL
jgi:UDP-N-acetylglucosamine 2-epimerase (non-hydrolysing)